jgi:hypothetical protein
MRDNKDITVTIVMDGNAAGAMFHAFNWAAVELADNPEDLVTIPVPEALAILRNTTVRNLAAVPNMAQILYAMTTISEVARGYLDGTSDLHELTLDLRGYYGDRESD